MKKALIFIFSILLTIACKEKQGKESVKLDQGAYAKSAGRLNTITVVMENRLWEGQLGETVRKYLAAPVVGLPQDEPMFTLKQMPPQAFSGFVRKSRNYIKFELSKPVKYKKYINKYARPQLGIHVTGYTLEEVNNAFFKRKKDIINAFKAHEFVHKQSFTKKPLALDKVKKEFGYTIAIPGAYRMAKEEKDFFWLRKNIAHGSMDLILYSVPEDFFNDELTTVENIIKMRDKVSGDNIVVDEGGRFITEEAYAPYLSETTLDGKKAYETKGTWEVKNKYMAGPFVNYCIHDAENKRYLVLEGFVFAPTIEKRDFMFKLESYIRTIKF